MFYFGGHLRLQSSCIPVNTVLTKNTDIMRVNYVSWTDGEQDVEVTNEEQCGCYILFVMCHLNNGRMLA
jgi:hypothetical protein